MPELRLQFYFYELMYIFLATSLAGLVVVLMILAQKIADLFDLVKTLFQF